ncbi:DEAD/DEAH box helicase [Halonotius aquaticus]|uniref:Putative DNA 3'-5' helicase Rad25 n=1 Tax=Halonotius aquaticus TaxID=2216978 RepID=A0A3A6QD01_9EURY|nr:DEAD/DEAH box helicase family protein [Halonotius aquaticus]RJX43889.1 DEAD/DEAH box helicase [Halonotius aquaticus]
MTDPDRDIDDSESSLDTESSTAAVDVDAAADVADDGDLPDDADATDLPTASLSLDDFYEVVDAEERPVLTASQVARRLDCSREEAKRGLDALETAGKLDRADVEHDPVVWYPSTVGDLAGRERVVLFPTRREIVVDEPTQYTRAQLAQFAHLVDSTGTEPGTRGYLYRIRQEDIWAAPFDDLDELLAAMHSVLPRQSPHLDEWVTAQWERASQFILRTHDDGYTVLEAANENLMGNVAQQKLPEDALRAPISETEAWVNSDEVATVKRTLYEAGYPVADDRELDTGDALEAELTATLREYQQAWVDTFLDQQAGVFVGPPGSGKTIAAIAALVAVGGETLILVPSRELAAQWREELTTHSTLTDADIGEYHGGTKEIRPVTIATYQTAGMDRHRQLFDSRGWGLIIYDEVQHIPSPIFRRSTQLQAAHRLGLSATPVREDDKEKEIFTLIGPPIGTDWAALFEAGFVAEPEVQIRYVPWRDDDAKNAYSSADTQDRHRIAAQNPAKIDEIRALRGRHPDAKTLIFVDYLDQGEAIADALDVPFISGETAHHERQRQFAAFRDGSQQTLVVSRIADEGIDLPNAELAIVASGLGGSRRQGTQRAGRTMRPVGNAVLYVLATRGSREEDFAQRQMRHMAGKGVRISETTISE